MRCDKFTEFDSQSSELEARCLAKDMAFVCDRFFDVVCHIRALRRRYVLSHLKPCQSAMSEKDWNIVKEETKERQIENGTKLLLEGWQAKLLRELKDLEDQVWHYLGHAIVSQ